MKKLIASVVLATTVLGVGSIALARSANRTPDDNPPAADDGGRGRGAGAPAGDDRGRGGGGGGADDPVGDDRGRGGRR